MANNEVVWPENTLDHHTPDGARDDGGCNHFIVLLLYKLLVVSSVSLFLDGNATPLLAMTAGLL